MSWHCSLLTDQGIPLSKCLHLMDGSNFKYVKISMWSRQSPSQSWVVSLDSFINVSRYDRVVKYAVIQKSGHRKEPSKKDEKCISFYRYSAPQSPIEVIIVRLLECFKIASIAQLSCIVRWKPYTS